MARRHLLIGGGPGAVAAAEAIRTADAGAEIVLVSVDPHGYYSRPGLAYYLAKEIPEKRLWPFTPKELNSLGFTSLTDRAVGIDPAGHTVTLENGGEVAFDRLLIATGSTAVPARVPGAELDGVVKLDDLDDARDIIRRSADAKNAVVVGGGITALEIVEGLRAHSVHVDYFMRQDRVPRQGRQAQRLVRAAVRSVSHDRRLGRCQLRSHGLPGRPRQQGAEGHLPDVPSKWHRDVLLLRLPRAHAGKRAVRARGAVSCPADGLHQVPSGRAQRRGLTSSTTLSIVVASKRTA